MSDTRADVVVAAATWTNLYTASSISVGTAVDIFNKGSDACLIAIKATQPTNGVGVPLYVGAEGSHCYVTASEAGLWAYSVFGTRLLVQEA